MLVSLKGWKLLLGRLEMLFKDPRFENFRWGMPPDPLEEPFRCCIQTCPWSCTILIVFRGEKAAIYVHFNFLIFHRNEKAMELF